jgi:DNA-binding response OmpR family regulator
MIDLSPANSHHSFRMAGILIIDDDPDTRDLLKITLEAAGHQVTLAADGSEGVRIYRSHKPDLVIMDLYMPGQEGLETIKQLRMEFPDVRILAVSGKPTGAAMLSVAQRLGAIGILQKPFLQEELLHAVEKSL